MSPIRAAHARHIADGAWHPGRSCRQCAPGSPARAATAAVVLALRAATLPVARWASGVPVAANHLAHALAANTMPTPIRTAALPAAGAAPAPAPAPAIAHPAPGREHRVVAGKVKVMTAARPVIRLQAAGVDPARAIVRHRAEIACKAAAGQLVRVVATVRNPVAGDHKVTADRPVAVRPAAATATAPAIAEQSRDPPQIEAAT